MTVKQLSAASGRSESWVYALARKLGRLPTVDEINSRKNKRGRPSSWSIATTNKKEN